MLRTVLAFILGLVSAVITIALIELVGAQLSPPPPGLDLTRPEHLATLMVSMPVGAKLLVLLAWIVGAFDGGLVAGMIDRQRGGWVAVAIGALVVAGVIANALVIPHPVWMLIPGVLVPIPAAWLAAQLAGRLRRRPA